MGRYGDGVGASAAAPCGFPLSCLQRWLDMVETKVDLVRLALALPGIGQS